MHNSLIRFCIIYIIATKCYQYGCTTALYTPWGGDPLNPGWKIHSYQLSVSIFTRIVSF